MQHAPLRMGWLPQIAQLYCASVVLWFYDGQTDYNLHRPIGSTLRYHQSYQLYILR